MSAAMAAIRAQQPATGVRECTTMRDPSASRGGRRCASHTASTPSPHRQSTMLKCRSSRRHRLSNRLGRDHILRIRPCARIWIGGLRTLARRLHHRHHLLGRRGMLLCHPRIRDIHIAVRVIDREANQELYRWTHARACTHAHTARCLYPSFDRNDDSLICFPLHVRFSAYPIFCNNNGKQKSPRLEEYQEPPSHQQRDQSIEDTMGYVKAHNINTMARHGTARHSKSQLIAITHRHHHHDLLSL